MSAAFERAFMAALVGDPHAGSIDVLVSPAFARQPGFAVYRNNVVSACIEALEANYPTVLALVGPDWFREAATAFVRGSWPDDGRMAYYGNGFAAFLRGFDPASALPYLAGVAELDRCWTEAHLAADAAPLDPAAVARWSPEELAAATLVPHPAARWARFDEGPIFTIWRRHREGADLSEELDWRAEAAFVGRPRSAVAWQLIDAESCAFLDACARGACFSDAAEASAIDPIDALPALFLCGAFSHAVPAASGAHERRP